MGLFGSTEGEKQFKENVAQNKFNAQRNKAYKFACKARGVTTHHKTWSAANRRAIKENGTVYRIVRKEKEE